jgi:hypothetical protein
MSETSDCVEILSAIPNAETCAACAHASRCAAFGFTSSMENRFCSFAPSRFRRAITAAEWIAAVDRNAERIATTQGEYGTPARDDEG